LELNPHKREIDAFLPEDVKLVGYQHHPAIPAPIAV
jgi:thymidylate synthase